MGIVHLTLKQHLKIKGPIVDTNNHLNRLFPSFNSLNKEISPSIYLVDVMGHLDTNNFYFILFYFSDFTLLYFTFLFFWRMMKKARDKEVTWQVTWCDIISLELDGRVWKMTSGHLEYTWWPWVGHEAGMRMKHGYKSRVIY